MEPWPRAEPAAPALRCAGLAAVLSLSCLPRPVAADAEEVEAEARLAFARRGEPVATLSQAALRERVPAATVRVHEPYEEGEARFRALPFAAVLDAVYGSAWREDEELLFTCRDGYQPTVPVARVLGHRPWLAFDRVGPEGFTIAKQESGARRRVSLAPFYLVWENLDDPLVRQEADYGWPYQLVGVDLIRTGDRFAAMMPPAGASPEVQAGFADFRIHCSKCHAVNGQGGAIGPELNAVANPLEYRPRGWLRTWIDDPSRIAPTARMPALNPALPDRERIIDGILAYLEAMAHARGSSGGT